MFHLVLGLAWTAVLAVICALPGARAASPDWISAWMLFGLAQAIVWMSAKWTRAGAGQIVFEALNWRYIFLLGTTTLPLFTLALLSIALGPEGGQLADPLIVAELGAMQFAAGLACQRTPRNRVIGFRTAATLSSDARWFAVNRRWGWWLAALAPLALLAIALPAYGPLAALLPILAVGIAFLVSNRA